MISKRFFLVTLATVVVASSTFSLGQWQLRRAAQKLSLQAAIEQVNDLAAIDNEGLLASQNIASLMHRPARLQGYWQPQHTLYLDNRPMSGKVGFWVLTPLRLAGSEQVVLVQRGWLSRDFMRRDRLLPVDTPVGLVTVQGRVELAPSKLYQFKGVDAGHIRQNIDLAEFRIQSGLPLMPVCLLQVGSPSEGLLRDWAPANFGVSKHYGYAFQWFALSALVGLLYLWFQLIVPYRAKKSNKL